MEQNGEKRWLTWVVRVILPALVGAMWLSIGSDIADLKVEVKELRCAVYEQQLEFAEVRADLEARLHIIEAKR